MLDWEGTAVDGFITKTTGQLREDIKHESEIMSTMGGIVRFDPLNNYNSIVKILAAIDSGTILAIGHDPSRRLMESEVLESLQYAGVVLAIKSSGTTSQNKTILLTRDNIIFDAISAGKALGISPGTRIYAALPFTHTYAITAGIIMALVCRSTIVLADTVDVSDTILFQKPDVILTVPMVVEALVDEVPFDNWNGWFVVGGSKMPTELMDRCLDAGIKIVEGYGLTECSPVVAVNSLRDIRTGSVGTPLSCNTVSIVEGEIVVSGKNVCFGILYNDELCLSNGVLHTGDYGKIKDGYLYIGTRKDSIVALSNGLNLDLEALEVRIINSDPRIRDCLVTYDGHLHIKVVSEDPEIAIVVKDTLIDMSYFISSVEVTSVDLERTALGKKKRIKHV